MTDPGDRKPRGPVDPLVVPRFAGPSTLRIEPDLPVVGQAVVQEIAGQLDPVDFNPTFFQLTAGLVLRF